jgi:hypothetical protein
MLLFSPIDRAGAPSAIRRTVAIYRKPFPVRLSVEVPGAGSVSIETDHTPDSLNLGNVGRKTGSHPGSSSGAAFPDIALAFAKIADLTPRLPPFGAVIGGAEKARRFVMALSGHDRREEMPSPASSAPSGATFRQDMQGKRGLALGGAGMTG